MTKEQIEHERDTLIDKFRNRADRDWENTIDTRGHVISLVSDACSQSWWAGYRARSEREEVILDLLFESLEYVEPETALRDHVFETLAGLGVSYD